MFKSLGFICATALMAVGQVQPAICADPTSRSTKVNLVSEGNAQQRELTPLDEHEIRKALIGQRIEIDLKMEKRSIWFSEEFPPDGNWRLNQAARGMISRSGPWRIHDGKICTRVTNERDGLLHHPEVCRRVWRDKLSGKIAMISPDNISTRILFFSSSPLK